MVIVQKKILELSVGIFMILAICGLVFLALKVSGLTSLSGTNYYTVYADFDNVGDLKIRAPVDIAGVRVGEVSAISLNPEDFRAKVTLHIDKNQLLPVDTSASIYTQGLLGSNYINLSPGYQTQNLKDGSTIQDTTSALILEKLIGQFLFNINKGNNNQNSSGNSGLSK